MPENDNKNIKDVEGEIKLSRESTRTWLAKWIVYLFVSAIIISIIISVTTNINFDTFHIIISTLSGLLGVVLGFYFGKEGN